MFDLVVLSVPGTVSSRPPAAPALLKAAVQSYGFTCKTIDYNARFYKENLSNQHELESYFVLGLNYEVKDQARLLIEKYAKEVAALNPIWVGISIFTFQSRVATELFCQSIKNINNNIKIVLGGSGLSQGGIEGEQDFGPMLVDKGLVDAWIRSEGELAIVALLKGDYTYYGINSHDYQQIEELNDLGFPDYTDYDFNLYNEKLVPITSSRGCVRACSFCDIHAHWKYRYKSGNVTADEMIYLAEKHNIYTFYFTDSLVNGNLKEFKIFCKEMSKYNKNSNKKISWGGQFIVRSEKTLNKQFWQNLKEAGANGLSIGVETGSDAVRQHMNKQFTNDDLDYTMSMLLEYNIPCEFLIIVGYPTETEKDFQDTLDMFSKYKHMANSIIAKVNVGSTLAILSNTPLYDNAHRFRIELDHYENNWVALDNPELTLAVRLSRVRRLETHLKELGYDVYDINQSTLDGLENNLPKFETRNKVKKIIKLKASNG